MGISSEEFLRRRRAVLTAIFEADWGTFDQVINELRVDSWWSRDDRGSIYRVLDALIEEGEVDFCDGMYFLTDQGDARLFGDRAKT